MDQPRVARVVSIPAASPDEKQFLLAGLALAIVALGSGTLLAALTRAKRLEALR